MAHCENVVPLGGDGAEAGGAESAADDGFGKEVGVLLPTVLADRIRKLVLTSANLKSNFIFD